MDSHLYARLRKVRVRSHWVHGEMDDEYAPLVATWMLRLLLGRESAFRRFFDPKSGFHDHDVVHFLGLDDVDEDEVSPEVVKSMMADHLQRFSGANLRRMSLFRNLAMLSRHVRLTRAQQQVLAFAVLSDRCGAMRDCLNKLSITSESGFRAMLALALDLPPAEVKEALAASGTLRASRLLRLEIDRHDMGMTLMDGLAEALLADNENEQALIRHFLVPARAPGLQVSSYPHIREDIELLLGLLRGALDAGARGVNILLYGPPGTGKTELARLLAKEADATLFEVRVEDADGDCLHAGGRLDGYRLAQRLLGDNPSSIVLFDEVEDIFPVRSFSLFGTEMRSGDYKGWFNRALEENRAPTIWVCNQIRQIDPAFLRRFDYALELRTPPRSVRLAILQGRFRGTPASASLMQRLAELEELPPALVDSAARAIKRMKLRDQDQADAAVSRIIERNMRALGQKPLMHGKTDATRFSTRFIHANADIQSLIDGLVRRGHGNLCFYGPPGTGKTALARHIAECLDKPLLLRRTSDILSMWLGGTEQNIAQMFLRAREEGAVLVLDEADSFLRDRRAAKASWEVTQVNELLVQMEHFDGLFICSTNLIDDLDQASLRRFALKVRFDYLKPEQALALLEQECEGEVRPAQARTVAGMRTLTPGDFAAVKKRLAMLGEALTASALLQGLEDECRLKEGGQQAGSIGFVR